MKAKEFAIWFMLAVVIGTIIAAQVTAQVTPPTVSRASTAVQPPPTLYFSRTGRDGGPCTRRRPCDLDTGRKRLAEPAFAQTLVFVGLTPAEIQALTAIRLRP